METNPESPAPSTEELAELEAEFARLETELAALDDADVGASGDPIASGEPTDPTAPTASSDGGDG